MPGFEETKGKEKEIKRCLNCGADFQELFCSFCGQKEIAGRYSLSLIFKDFVQVVFLIESHLANTIKSLCLEPGLFVKSYLGGQRKPFMAPLQFFLLFVTVYFLVFNWVGDEFFKLINESVGTNPNEKAEVIGFGIIQMQAYVKRNLDLFYFFMPPILAAFYRLFYRKTQINYAESLIFSFYLVGIGLVFSSLMVIISLIEIRLMMLKVLLPLVFYPFAIVQFSNSKVITGYLKSMVVISLSYLVYGLVVVLITGFVLVSG